MLKLIFGTLGFIAGIFFGFVGFAVSQTVAAENNPDPAPPQWLVEAFSTPEYSFTFMISLIGVSSVIGCILGVLIGAVFEKNPGNPEWNSDATDCDVWKDRSARLGRRKKRPLH